MTVFPTTWISRPFVGQAFQPDGKPGLATGQAGKPDVQKFSAGPSRAAPARRGPSPTASEVAARQPSALRSRTETWPSTPRKQVFGQTRTWDGSAKNRPNRGQS